ncbi:MAG: hypothetical protein M0R48_03095 [Candidatus Omnitrophica bacterium]|jgi:predicted amino acid dehydrogenase|nr:hypothetical protein [Candidatus Omnitrophota bacterium]
MPEKYNNCPSQVKNFKSVINKSLHILNNVDSKVFFSPYSTIPIISQMLGLNTPIAGSGDYPYSITSIIFQIEKEKQILQELFNIPLIEKRKIIDEIYEMIAPVLLGEEDNYIELLFNIKYKNELRFASIDSKNNFKRLFKEKFSILQPFIARFNNKKGDFGYIVHYGYLEDLYREYDFLQKIPNSLANEWRQYSYPIVNEILIKGVNTRVPGVKSDINGWVIFVTNHTRELLESGKLRKHKILQAARLAEKLGAKIIGMGGLIASFAQGGYWLSEQMPNVGFTTGHVYTIGNIIEMARNCSKKINLNIKKATIAIVGAAGSIGSGCAKLIAEDKPKHFILLDLSTFSATQKLEELKNNLQNISPKTKIVLSNNFFDVRQADLVIVATNSPTSIIKPEYLKKGAIIIDDSFPKNVSKEILKIRNDIILLEGGMMRLPISIDITSARNMPDLMDLPLTRAASCKETYGCLAEVLVLALYGYKKNYALGYADPVLAKDIVNRAKKIGFSSAPLQCFDEAIDDKKFILIKRILKKERQIV